MHLASRRTKEPSVCCICDVSPLGLIVFCYLNLQVIDDLWVACLYVIAGISSQNPDRKEKKDAYPEADIGTSRVHQTC
jgi:hypothetical protein